MKKNYENLDLEVIDISKVDLISTSDVKKEETDTGDNETPFPTW